MGDARRPRRFGRNFGRTSSRNVSLQDIVYRYISTFRGAWQRIRQPRGGPFQFLEQVHALEATQGQVDGFFSQPPYKCHLEEVTSVGD